MTVERGESINFDQIAERYDETRGGDARGARFGTAVAAHLPPGPAVEIGVGTGAIAVPVVAAGHPVCGVDISHQMLLRAQARLGARVARADAMALPLADASIDAAYSVWVLHLVADVGSLLAEVTRVLRPGGVYVVSGSGSERSDEGSEMAALDHRWRRVTDAEGGRRDHPDRVVAMAAAAGLSVVHRGWVVSEELSATPNEVAELLETRTFSSTWNVDAVTWAAEVVPVINTLRALPDPDVGRSYHQRSPLLVLRR